MNMSLANKAHFGDKIYSTVDACQTAQEIWEAIERLQQGESLNIQDVKTNLFWEFGKFTSHDGELMESYYTRFYKLMNEIIRNNLNVATMQVNVQFLKQLQPEWSRTVNVAGARENIVSPVVQQYGIQCFSCKEFRHFAKECRKPKRVKDSAYHKEKMLMCKQAEQGVPLQAEQYDWLADTDEEINEQELKAYYSYLAKIQEVPTADSGTNSEPFNTCLVETDDSNVTPDSPNMCEDDIHNDQNDVESDDERVALANLIANLKLDEIEELESDKAEFSNMYDMILQECVSHDVMCSYLLSLSDLDVLAELQCLYLHKVKECDCLAQNLLKQTESVSKEVHNELLQCFAKVEKHSISLEIALQKCKEQVKNDTVWNEKASNVFRKKREQYIEIQDLKAQLQDKNIAISELKKLIEKGKGNSVEIKFDKPSVFAPILSYGDLVPGNITINRVYYIEGLNHNLFSVGQFCDANLEVAFRKSTCFVRDLQGNDLLTDYDNSDPVRQLQNVSSLADAHIPSQQELDLLFGPLYDEFFNAGSNPKDTQPITNIQPTSAPSTPTYVHAKENNNDQAE
nr:integrase, catalytic region, zinc finger, CCHC-type, peptidase aspartic, catalytic [Tanacetum cinerariifolium]